MSALNDHAPATPPEAKPPAGADQPPGGEPASGGPARRPVIPVAQLAAHPGNVRRDLDLSPDFLASVQANGVLVPLRVTPDSDGGYRVIDGHRRLAAAIQAGLAEVPADIAADRAGDEPGQYLDMWTANRHHAPLTLLEEADALFSARDAGAAKTRIRRSTGLKAPQLDAALSAARLSQDTRAAVDALPQDLTLEDLAILAEFDGQDEAIARLTQAAGWGHSLEHQAELLRQEHAARAEHERLRRDLQDAGVTLTDSLPPGGQLLAVLSHDGQDLTPEAHASCPGRGAYFRPYDQATPVYYCADPDAHGHAFRYASPGTGPPAPASRPGRAGSLTPGRPMPAAGWSSRATGHGRPLPRSASAGCPRICSPAAPRPARPPSSPPGSCWPCPTRCARAWPPPTAASCSPRSPATTPATGWKPAIPLRAAASRC